MKFALLRSFFLAALLAMGALVVAAQPAGLMFAGERLVYDGKISRFRVSISVAELTVSATVPTGKNELLIKTDAVSKGTLLKMFRYSFVQQYESTIDLANFRILKTVKHDVQKERVRDSEAIFDYVAHRVIYVETDPKDPHRPPRRIASEIGDLMQDMVSAVYYARLQKLEPGKRFDVPVSDSGLVYTVPVVVGTRQKIDTVLGKRTPCIRIEPQIFGPTRLIDQKGKMVIWLTDDDRHVPVRGEVDSNFGKIDIRLKSIMKAG